MHIQWNDRVRLIFSDVDETVADVYLPATPEMVTELEKLLQEDKILYLMSGGSLQSIRERIVDFIKPSLRRNIYIAHCHGAEVYGFSESGDCNMAPFFSIYNEKLFDQQKKEFREVVQQLISEYRLETFPTMPKKEFAKVSEGRPLAIMLADRGAQITFELANASNLTQEQVAELGFSILLSHGEYDLRISLLERAKNLFKEKNIPVYPRLGGTFALDFAVEGVSKTSAINWLLNNKNILIKHQLTKEQLLTHPELMEIWGDKYSTRSGGPDQDMCLALPKEVRAIDFRQEDPAELPEGYNVQLWDGKKQLQEGLLEYLQSRYN